MVPSSCTMGALSHLSMYNSAHLHVMCFRTARSKSSWSMLSNRPFMSNSRTQSYFQHRSRVAPTASKGDPLSLDHLFKLVSVDIAGDCSEGAEQAEGGVEVRFGDADLRALRRRRQLGGTDVGPA